MSHRLSACELGEHVDEDLRLPPPSAAVGSRLALPEAHVVPALGSLTDSARGAPAQPHDRCAGNSHDTRGGGDLSPPAAGPTDAEREPAPVKAPRPDRSTGMAAAGGRARAIRRENVYTEGMPSRASVTRPAGEEPVSRCARCEQTGRTCNACVQRRHRAWKLVDCDGATIEEAAVLMRLPAATVRVLVERERDRLEVAQYRINSIPTARARAFLEQQLQSDPGLTRAEVARRMNMNPADFDHQLGYAAKKTNGAKQQRVGIPLASRLTLALGRAPYELEGC